MAGIGGATKGSGRKPRLEPTKQLTINVPITHYNWLSSNVKNKTAFFRGAVMAAMKKFNEEKEEGEK